MLSFLKFKAEECVWDFLAIARWLVPILFILFAINEWITAFSLSDYWIMWRISSPTGSQADVLWLGITAFIGLIGSMWTLSNLHCEF